jgi:hypothetical protein
MKASVGDRIIISSSMLDRPVRDGEIVELRRTDGRPPYVVRWSDTGKTAVFFPGVDARVDHPAPAEPKETAGEPTPERHVKTWRVRVDLFESGDDTTAHAVLTSESPQHLDADGRARRDPRDPAVPEIGDEVAVSRALRRLADRLLDSASSDLAAVTGQAVSLRH